MHCACYGLSHGHNNKQIELKKGEGSIVRLKQCDAKTGQVRESKYWYILYYHAYDMLVSRRRDSTEGKQPVSDVRKLRYEDLRDTYIEDLKLGGKESLYERTNESGQTEYTFRGLDHFNKFFKGMSASLITTDKIRDYIRWRQREGNSDPTIRRQLVHLRAMFKLAHKEQNFLRCRTSRCRRIRKLPDNTSTQRSLPNCSNISRRTFTRFSSFVITPAVESVLRKRLLGRW